MRQHYQLAIGLLVTRTITLFRAVNPGQLCGEATLAQETATDGTKSVKIRNLTRGVDMTEDKAISGLGAGGSTTLALGTVGNRQWRKGDVIAAVYTATVAGAVAPTNLSIDLDMEYASQARGMGEIGG